MADLSFTIPDEHFEDFKTYLAAHYGYQAILSDGTDNPETTGAYARRKLIAEMKARVKLQKWVEAEKQIVVEDIDIT